ncbi:MAG: monovalent cation/H+ antiporter subunit A [Alcanivoracaceae bacterium]|nr:monovalent cation/H+ antiporter subunit A [Alcanivoracaceae bacterium]
MLYLFLALPFVGAILPALAGNNRNLGASLAALAPLAALTGLLLNAGPIFDGGALVASVPWAPTLGLNLTVRIDGLAFLFAVLVLGIGLLIILYARYYLSARDSMPRFYALLLFFMGAMLGIVVSGNLLMMLVFWELTSIASFLLIGFWSHREDARKGARMALAITGGGGLCLLAGILLLGNIVGSYELDVVLAAGDVIRAHPLYAPMLILVLLGAFTKSAQFPFHFWLPHAMAAPTPVSAYLHSATMVKAGVFLLARLFPALSGTELWTLVVSSAGMATLLIGAYVALFKHDLKGLLAYSTLSHLGLITLLFGFNTPLAAVAAVFHIINHATFKASLFMAAGIIDHETGTRDMRRINGLWKYMPHTAVLAMVAAAAMAGVPLMNGFLSKEMFFAESLHLGLSGIAAWLPPLVATLAGVFSVAYSVRFIHDVFFNGEPIDLPKYPPHEPPRYMKIPVEILVAVCVLVGVAPAWIIAPLLDAAAGATLNGNLPDYSLAVWHGLNLPLMMSVIALVGGLLIYAFRHRLFSLHERLPEVDEKRVFEGLVRMSQGLAWRVTRVFENDSLQDYLRAMLMALVLALFAGLWLSPVDWRLPQMLPVDIPTVALGALLVVAAGVTALWHRKRVFALLLLSVVGLVVSVTFIRFSAPDLALTQLVVEVVTVLLLMLALFFLPDSAALESTARGRVRDAVLSSLVGIGVGAMAWLMMTTDVPRLADWFMAQSVPGGGGTNVVNVILVDFRGFDTFGEITVLAIAALGIYALLRELYLKAPELNGRGRPWAMETHPLILEVVSRPLLSLSLLVSLYIFLRGHNLPGGGFIAGLVTSVALLMQYVANGVSWVQSRIRSHYLAVTGIGLSVALVTGMGSWFFDRPFLTSAHGYLTLPVIGKMHLASALLFDIGVYLTVVGATLLMLSRLGRVSTLDRKRGGH